jgi:hypothetical protein
VRALTCGWQAARDELPCGIPRNSKALETHHGQTYLVC